LQIETIDGVDASINPYTNTLKMKFDAFLDFNHLVLDKDACKSAKSVEGSPYERP